MIINKARRGSALFPFLIIIMAVFLLIAVALRISFNSARTSELYEDFSWRYDGALMLMEQTENIIRDFYEQNADAIKSATENELRARFAIYESSLIINAGRIELPASTYWSLRDEQGLKLLSAHLSKIASITPEGWWRLSNTLNRGGRDYYFEIKIKDSLELISGAKIDDLELKINGKIKHEVQKEAAHIEPTVFDWRSGYGLFGEVSNAGLGAPFWSYNSSQIIDLNGVTDALVTLGASSAQAYGDYNGVILALGDVELHGQISGLVIANGNIIANLPVIPDSSAALALNWEELAFLLKGDFLKALEIKDFVLIQPLKILPYLTGVQVINND